MRSHKKNSYYKLCLIHELGVFAAKIHTQIKMPKENYIFLIQSLDSNFNTRIVLINEFACMDKAAVVIVLDTLYNSTSLIINSILGFTLSINFSATIFTQLRSFLIALHPCRQSSTVLKQLSRSGRWFS